jgi:hypothetical protein
MPPIPMHGRAAIVVLQGVPQPAGDIDFSLEGQGGEEMVVVAEAKAQQVKGERGPLCLGAGWPPAAWGFRYMGG